MANCYFLAICIFLACATYTTQLPRAQFIIGGTDAGAGSYPWMALIKVRGTFVCGGSLISDKLVLTASHCFNGVPESDVNVILGEHKRGTKEGSEKTVSVSRIHWQVGGVDMAIVELTCRLQLNSKIRTIGLSSDEPTVGDLVTVIGWGWTQPADSFSAADNLQQLKIPTADTSTCNTELAHNAGNSVSSYEFCAGYAQGEYLNICHGDSGSPVMRQKHGIYYLDGVAVRGPRNCPNGNHYGVFIHVDSFRNRIDTIKRESTGGSRCSTASDPLPKPAPKKASCFPADATLKLESGETKLMEQLQVGDRVQAISPEGRLVFSDVIMMMHAEANIIQPYYVIQTDFEGTQLRLTADHMVYIQKTTEKMADYILAKNVEVGDYLLAAPVDALSGHLFNKIRITNVTVANGNGIYAPLTMEGTVVVDNVAASCYTLLEHQSTCHAVFSPARLLYKWFPELLLQSSTTAPDTSGEHFHWYPELLRTVSAPFLQVMGISVQ